VSLLGREEAGELDETGRQLLRLMLPLTKLVTGKQSVHVASEVLEAFGGAGYVEDTGLPLLLRDSQVLPIWEGTTNVLSLDALLRTDIANGLRAWRARISTALDAATDPKLAATVRVAHERLQAALAWFAETKEPEALQSGARRFALTLGRSMQLALLAEHAQWAAGSSEGEGAMSLAERLAHAPLASLDDLQPATDAILGTL
jgi:hypothetical protein